MHKPINLVEHLAHHHSASLERYVAARFPNLSLDLVADAVADAIEVAVADPELVASAWQRGGINAAVGLLRVIAWRFARAQVRRACWRRTLPEDGVVDLGRYQEPDQEYVTHVRRVLPVAMLEGARQARARNPEAVLAAVADRLLTGHTDGAVAERHDVCREQVNRARGYVVTRILSEA